MNLRIKNLQIEQHLIELTNSGSTISWIYLQKKIPKSCSDEMRMNQLRDEFSAWVITAGNRAANSIGFAIRAIRWNHARLRTPRRVTRVRSLMGARNAWAPRACFSPLSHSLAHIHTLFLSLSPSSFFHSLRCTGGLSDVALAVSLQIGEPLTSRVSTSNHKS